MITQSKKLYTILSIVLATMQFALATDQDLNRSVSDKGKCCKKVLCADLVKAKKVWTERLDVEKDCKACRTITREDFLHDGYFSKTFVIDEPGKYCLGENIPFEPENEGDVAIIIDASNVKLDLCCNKLEQANSVPAIKGIELVEGNENIIITNGTLCHFQGCAIFAFIPDAATLLPPNPFTTGAAGSSIVTVNQPGHGLMTGDVVAIARADGFDNLTSLDLNGEHTITVIDANNYTIDVSPGKAGQGGISGGGNDVRVVDKFTNQPTLDGLCFTDLTIVENGDGSGQGLPCNQGASFCTGIFLTSDALGSRGFLQSRFAYNDVLVRNNKINRNSHGGVLIRTTDNLIIEDTQINGTFVTTDFSNLTAVDIARNRNVRMSNCQVNSIQHSNPASIFTTITGILPSGSICVSLENVELCDIVGDAFSIMWALNLSLTQDVSLENCSVNRMRGGPLCATMQCIHATDDVGGSLANEENTNNSFRISNCQFNDLTRPTEGNHPFFQFLPFINQLSGMGNLFGKNFVFENNQISNLRTGNPNYGVDGATFWTAKSDAIGSAGANRNFVVRNNVISDIVSGGALPTANFGAVGIGFFVFGSTSDGVVAETSNITIENNNVLRIQDATKQAHGIIAALGDVTSGLLQGDPFDVPAKFYILNNVVSDVQGADTVSSAGIFVDSTKDPVVCGNVVNKCTNGIVFTGSDVINPPNFFQLAETLNDALAFPPVVVDLTNLGTGMQNFNNLPQGNTVTVDASNGSFVRLGENGIVSPVDLNILGWQVGDQVLYDAAGGDPIEELVDTTTYFAVVYVPGFTECGLVQENKVTNCAVAGYRDDREPTTSAWVNNVAVKNGPTPDHDENYDISWPLGTPQVDEGTLGAYPANPNKYFNLSLIPN